MKNINKKNTQGEVALSLSTLSKSVLFATTTMVLMASTSTTVFAQSRNNETYLQSDLAQNEQLYKEVQAAQMGFVLNSNQPSQLVDNSSNATSNNNNINTSNINTSVVKMGPRPDAVYTHEDSNLNNTTHTVNTVNNIHEVDIHNIVIATPMNSSQNNQSNISPDELRQERAFQEGLRHEASPTMEPSEHLAIQENDSQNYMSAQLPMSPVAPKYWGNDNQNYNANLATDNQIFADDKNGDSNGIHTHTDNNKYAVKTVNVEDIDPYQSQIVTQRFNFSNTVNYPLQQPTRPEVQNMLNTHPEKFYVLNMSLVKRDDVKDVTQVLVTARDYVQNNDTYNFKYHTNQIYSHDFYCSELYLEQNIPTVHRPEVSENNYRPYLNVTATPHINNNGEQSHIEFSIGAQLIDRLAPVKTSILCDGKNYKAVMGSPYTVGIKNKVDVITPVGAHQAIQLSNHYYLVYWLETLSTLSTAQVK